MKDNFIHHNTKRDCSIIDKVGKVVQSNLPPPHTAALGTGEKMAVLEDSGKGSHI